MGITVFSSSVSGSFKHVFWPDALSILVVWINFADQVLLTLKIRCKQVKLLYKTAIKMKGQFLALRLAACLRIFKLIPFLLITVFQSSEQCGKQIKMWRVNLQRTVSYKETKSSTKINFRIELMLLFLSLKIKIPTHLANI